MEAGRPRAEYVGGHEAGIDERLEVAVNAAVLKRVCDLGGLYALEHVFGVLLVRGDALFGEEFFALLLDLRRVRAVADDPGAVVAYEVDRLDLQVFAFLAGLDEDGRLVAANLLARYLKVGRGELLDPLEVRLVLG